MSSGGSGYSFLGSNFVGPYESPLYRNPDSSGSDEPITPIGSRTRDPTSPLGMVGGGVSTNDYRRLDAERFGQLLSRVETGQLRLADVINKIGDSLLNRINDQRGHLDSVTNKIIEDLSRRLQNCESKCTDCTCKLVQQLANRLNPAVNRTNELTANLPILEDFGGPFDDKSGSNTPPVSGPNRLRTPLDPDTPGGVYEPEPETEQYQETEPETETETETDKPAATPLSVSPYRAATADRSATPDTSLDELKKWADGMYENGKQARENKEQLERYRKDKDCCDITVQLRQVGNMVSQFAQVFPKSPIAILLNLLNPNETDEEIKRELKPTGSWSPRDQANSVEAPDVNYWDERPVAISNIDLGSYRQVEYEECRDKLLRIGYVIPPLPDDETIKLITGEVIDKANEELSTEAGKLTAIDSFSSP